MIASGRWIIGCLAAWMHVQLYRSFRIHWPAESMVAVFSTCDARQSPRIPWLFFSQTDRNHLLFMILIHRSMYGFIQTNVDVARRLWSKMGQPGRRDVATDDGVLQVCQCAARSCSLAPSLTVTGRISASEMLQLLRRRP